MNNMHVYNAVTVPMNALIRNDCRPSNRHYNVLLICYRDLILRLSILELSVILLLSRPPSSVSLLY